MPDVIMRSTPHSMTYADFGLGDVALVKGFVLEELVAYQTGATEWHTALRGRVINMYDNNL